MTTQTSPQSLLSPSITFIDPASGPISGGTQVTINGDNFVNGCRVKFGGVDSPQVTFNNSNQIVAVTPAQAALGAVNVRIINPDGQLIVLQDAFQYVQPPPTPSPSITFISPVSGPVSGGTQVTINGDNFVNGCRVKFGGVDSPQVIFINSNQLIATTPSQSSPGLVNVRVVNPDGQANVLQDAFQCTQPPPAPAPTISFVNPASGPLAGGTQVTINGQNFAPGCIVRFGGVDSPQVTFISSNQVNAITPQQAVPGPVNVRLVNPDGQANVLQNAFQYVLPPAPSIASVSPNSGPVAGGTQVVINGDNFASGCVVRFGGVDAQVISRNSIQITAITPASSAGPGFVTVRVVNPDGQPGILNNAFQYTQPALPPAPSIASVIPDNGPLAGGTQVTINGDNFANGCRARFGGIDALQTTFINSSQLIATTPAQQVAGTVTVRVVNPDGQPGILNSAFQYTQPAPVPAPSISSVAPNVGPLAGGTQVTIQGQNFVSGCRVKFGGIDAQTTFNNSNQLTITTPSQSVAGLVNIRVINPDQQVAVRDNAFEYQQPAQPPAPTISVLNPASGPPSGGTSVTINGQNFVSGCKVRFGGVDSMQVTFNNSTRLTAMTPPQAAGTVNVRVVNPDGQANALPNAFQYVQPPPITQTPSIASVTPNSSPLAGGTQVTINGQNFASGCQVKFGNVNAPQVTFDNANQLTAIAPPQSTPGPVDVRVTNPDGKTGALPGAFQYVAPAPEPVKVQVVSPNGGETVKAGTSLQIKWTSSGATEQRVEYALDGSATFMPVVVGLAGTVQTYTWNIPSNLVPTGKTQAQTVIRIVARNAPDRRRRTKTTCRSRLPRRPPKNA